MKSRENIAENFHLKKSGDIRHYWNYRRYWHFRSYGHFWRYWHFWKNVDKKKLWVKSKLPKCAKFSFPQNENEHKFKNLELRWIVDDIGNLGDMRTWRIWDKSRKLAEFFFGDKGPGYQSRGLLWIFCLYGVDKRPIGK